MEKTGIDKAIDIVSSLRKDYSLSTLDDLDIMLNKLKSKEIDNANTNIKTTKI